MTQLENIRQKHWKDLGYYDWRLLEARGIINGCGGGGKGFFRVIARLILKTILKIIKAAFIIADCRIHDFVYWQGGDGKRRKECDLGFYKKIREDIKYKTGRDDFYFRRLLFYILAFLFYISVRLLGWAFFNYTKDGGIKTF